MNNPRRRRIRWLLFSPIVVFGLLASWGALDAHEGASGGGSWNSRWRSVDGDEVGGYLVFPTEAQRYLASPLPGTPLPASRSTDGRYPAVLLLHEWWGLTNEIVLLADALAADGYIVLAPDLLRGRLAVTVPGAFVQMITTRQRRIAVDLDQARAHLLSLPDVDPRRVAVAGFCFGGTQAMHAGARWEDNGATVLFYGGSPIQDPAELGYLGASAPLLAIFGSEDRTIPLDHVRRFEEILSGRDVEVVIYEGVGHAFVDPISIRSAGSGAEAWYRFRRFLQETL